VARDFAYRGDYDSSIDKFKECFSIVHNYSKRYDAPAPTGAVGGYAAQTTSSAKKAASAKYQAQQHAAGGADYYLQEKWS
jgi:hypothetical protein